MYARNCSSCLAEGSINITIKYVEVRRMPWLIVSLQFNLFFIKSILKICYQGN
jgi:hypothetical protein